MFGGSNVVIASRSRIGRLDGRDRLRRQLLTISYHTVTSAGTRPCTGARTRPCTGTRSCTGAGTGPSTGTRPCTSARTSAGTRAAAGPGCGVRHDSSRCRVSGE